MLIQLSNSRLPAQRSTRLSSPRVGRHVGVGQFCCANAFTRAYALVAGETPAVPVNNAAVLARDEGFAALSTDVRKGSAFPETRKGN